MLRWHEMRAWVLVLLAACSGASSRGPSWPKTAAAETDGGETLAPHTATAKAAAAASSDDDDSDDDAPVAAATPAKAADKPADKAADKPAEKAADEPIQTEEIIIEIDD